MAVITTRTLKSICSKSKPFFIRDSKFKGFGVKVNPTGKLNFIVEVWHNGKSRRRTLGTYPALTAKEVRQ